MRKFDTLKENAYIIPKLDKLEEIVLQIINFRTVAYHQIDSPTLTSPH